MEQNRISSVVIVGGGPTGLVSAILLSKIIKNVFVLEKKDYPIDKVCGEGLMPRAVSFLKEESILDDSFFKNKNNYYQFTGINFTYRDTFLEGKFPLGKSGVGIKRSVLSQALFQRAQECGVVFYTQARVFDIINNPQQASVHFICNGEKTITSDLILLCDGINSPLKQKLGINKHIIYPDFLKSRGEFPIRLGARNHYLMRPWSEKVEVHWAEGVEAYVTPLSDNLIGVAWLFDSKKFKCGASANYLINYFPVLKEKLNHAKSIDDFLVFGPMGYASEVGYIGKICLLGDSYSFYDGITGEGLSSSFEQCHLLFKTLTRLQKGEFNNLGQAFYQFELDRKKIVELTNNHCSLVLYLSVFRLIKNLVFKFLNEFPIFFQRLLALNVNGQKLTLRNFLKPLP